MNHVDFLAARILRDDKGWDMVRAKDAYIEMPRARRAFYRARVSLEFGILLR